MKKSSISTRNTKTIFELWRRILLVFFYLFKPKWHFKGFNYKRNTVAELILFSFRCTNIVQSFLFLSLHLHCSPHQRNQKTTLKRKLTKTKQKSRTWFCTLINNSGATECDDSNSKKLKIKINCFLMKWEL